MWNGQEINFHRARFNRLRQSAFSDWRDNKINRDRSRSPIPAAHSDSEDDDDDVIVEFDCRSTFESLNGTVFTIYHMIHFIEKRTNPFKGNNRNNLDRYRNPSPESDSEEDNVMEFDSRSVFRDLNQKVLDFYNLIRFARLNTLKDSGRYRRTTHRRNSFPASYSFSEDIIMEYRYIYDDLIKMVSDVDYMICVIGNRWNGFKDPNKDRSRIPTPASCSNSEEDIIIMFDSRSVFEDLKNIVLGFYRTIGLIEDKFSPYTVFSRKKLFSYPLMKFQDVDRNAIFNVSQCIFCLQKFRTDSVIRKMSCNHVFHERCSDVWFKNNIRCPVCQKYMVKNEIIVK